MILVYESIVLEQLLSNYGSLKPASQLSGVLVENVDSESNSKLTKWNHRGVSMGSSWRELNV